jgi:hypothetical protein
MKKAIVALARRLAVIMHRIWVDGTEVRFDEKGEWAKPRLLMVQFQNVQGGNLDLPSYAETCRMLGACDLRAALPNLFPPTTVIVDEEDYASPVAMAQALRPRASFIDIAPSDCYCRC